MESVGAGLCREIDDAACKAAILGPEIVGLDFKFLNDILTRDHRDNVQVRPIGRRTVN